MTRFGSKFCGLTTFPCRRSKEDEGKNQEKSTTTTPSAESKLLEIMTYPLTTAWLLGYQPLTIVAGPTSSSLTFKPFSLKSLYCYAMILFSVSAISYMIQQQPALSSKYDLKQPIEVFSQQFEGWFTNMATTFLKLFGFFQVKKTLSLWKKNVELLETGQSLQFLGGSSEQVKVFEELQKSVKKSSRRLLIPVTFYIASLCSFVIASNIAVSVHDKTAILDSVYLFHWTWSAYFHSGYQLFILAFVKFYASCFHLISLEFNQLKVMCQPQQQQQSHISVDIDSDSMAQQQPRKLQDGVTTYIHVASLAGIMGKNNNPSGGNLEIKNSRNENNDGGLKSKKIRKRLDASFKFIKSIELTVDNYNSHFSIVYIIEIFLCILKIVVYSFFVLLFFVKNSDIEVYGKGFSSSITRMFGMVATGIPVILYGFSLYNFGTEASKLDDSAKRIAIDLEDLSFLIPPGVDQVGSTRSSCSTPDSQIILQACSLETFSL